MNNCNFRLILSVFWLTATSRGDKVRFSKLFDFKPKQGDLYFELKVVNNESLLKVIIDESNASNINIEIYNLNGEIMNCPQKSGH